MKHNDLISCCGLYCGCCARYKGFTAFREAARIVKDIVDSHGYHYWMPGMVKDFNYTEFRKGLDFMGKENSWLVCHGCRGGKGGPPSCVRSCCQKHNVDICFECAEFPCEKAKQLVRRGKEYKKLGKKEWLRQQVEKAKQNFEFHTGKYYKILAKGHSRPRKPGKIK